MRILSLTVIAASLLGLCRFAPTTAQQRSDLSDLQGKWSVEEYFPKTAGANGSSLACQSNLDVSYEITGNIWRRFSSNPDRFNSNGKYYILQAVKGSELNYVKFRVFADLVTEVQPCIGYVREGRILRIQMNTTDYTQCPKLPDEYAGVCNRYAFSTATCTGGRCAGGPARPGSRSGSGSGSVNSDGESGSSGGGLFSSEAVSLGVEAIVSGLSLVGGYLAWAFI
ncbi:hypothetical protein HK102_001977 [Quaeritorhiza haematococci]|nr:hypothetical protein HK102_001977 [Quaeritorhiza haematococci]